jgi:ferrochelatase
VDVLCPGFLTDGLETLEEIALEGKQVFLNAGGGELHYLPALNDGPDAVATLAAVVRSRLADQAAEA